MCAPSPFLPSLPFSLRLCGIIAGLLWLQKGRLAKYALPGSPAHAVSAALNPPFTIWYFLASKHLHLRNQMPKYLDAACRNSRCPVKQRIFVERHDQNNQSNAVLITSRFREVKLERFEIQVSKIPLD